MISVFRCLLFAVLCGGLLGQSEVASSATPSSSGWFARVWQTEDGLPDNNVTGVAQTPEGYLWVATHAGLARFDGARFQRIPLSGGAALPRRMIRASFLGAEQTVWLALEGGVVIGISRQTTNAFTAADGLPNFRPQSVTQDGAGSVWIGYADGIACRIREGRVTRFTSRDGLSGEGSCWLVTDKAGRLWFAKGGQVGTFEGERFQPRFELRERTVRLSPAPSGGLWISADTRLLKWDGDRGLIEMGHLPALRPGTSVSVILEDRSGDLWIGTSASGLWRYSAGRFEKVMTSHEEILSITEDREGNIWVGTGGGGLNRLRPRVLELQDAASGLPFEIVRSMCEDTAGVLWIAEQNGTLARLEQGRWAVVSTNAGWRGGPATCVAADRAGTVWIGTQRDGLYRWHDGQFTGFDRLDGLAGDSVRALLVDARGDLWIGLESSNCVQRLSGGTFRTFGLPWESQPVRAMVEDVKGNIWLGTGSGLLLRAQGDELVDETPRTLSPALPIRSLHTTPDGSVWIGYAIAGLGRMKAGKFTRVGSEQGLPDDYISQILSDERGALWLAGNRGMLQVREAELDDVMDGRAASVRVRRYGKDEALPNLQGSYGYAPGAIRSRDGRLWFPMLTGLAVVHPDRVSASQLPPPVLIENMVVDERTTSLPNAGPRRLPPNHRRVEFDFTALSFVAPENLSFRYRLDGLDDNWVQAGAQRHATYSRLPAGNYQFLVAACNSFGVWSTPAATLSFVVAPFVWQTWWFRIGGSLALVAMLAGVIRGVERRRFRRRMEFIERQHALERERIRIARDIHDELGAGLTQIGMLADLGLGSPVDQERVRGNFKKIQARARGAVTALDEIVWAVNPRNDNLTRLADYLCHVADDCFEVGPTRCRKEVPTGLPPVPVAAELRHNLALAVKEALTNALKHSGAQTVWLRLEWNAPELTVLVEDDGTGFNPHPAQANGNGLRNQAMRMKDIGGRVEIISDPGRGTHVRFQVRLDGAP